jgi:hypothetical protein
VFRPPLGGIWISDIDDLEQFRERLKGRLDELNQELDGGAGL